MNSKVNIHKLNQQWLSILRQAKEAELHQDITLLRCAFEKAMDCKDNTVKLLVSDLSEPQSAYMAHLQRMDHLLQVHRRRLAALESHWNASVQELSTEHSMEREILLKLHEQEREYFKAEILALEERYAEIHSKAVEDYQRTYDSIKNWHLEEGMVKELQQQYQQGLEKYIKATKDQDITTSQLDHAIQKTSPGAKHMQKLQANVNALLFYPSSSLIANEEFARSLQTECEELGQKVQQLREKLMSDQAAEKVRLANHALYSENARKALQNIIAEGEKLLSLADVCHKLESEQEKVLPVCIMSSMNSEDLSQENAHAMQLTSEELAEKEEDYKELEQFWLRYNKVILDHLRLEHEKNVLEQENQQLKLVLKRYLDEISDRKVILTEEPPFRVSCAPIHASPPALKKKNQININSKKGNASVP